MLFLFFFFIMKITLTEGCICDSLVIDGKESSECTSEELLSAIRKILYKESSKFNLIGFLDQVIDIFSDYASFAGDSCRYGRFLISFDENEDIIVNNKYIKDFNEDEIRDIIIEIINSGKNQANLVWTLRGLVQIYGKYKFCYHCDECGDDVVEYKLKI